MAEIKLRHLNKEYILKRIDEIEKLKEEIAKLESILKSDSKVKKVIVAELKEVAKKYGKDRKTEIIHIEDEPEYVEVEEVPDYACHLFFTLDGYFKKITPQSLRMSGEQKLKEGDEIIQQIDSNNNNEVMFFTDRSQVYKAKLNDFSDTKASVLGDYIPAVLDFDKDENTKYNAYSDKSPLVKAFYIKEDTDIIIENINGRKLLVNTSAFNVKTSKNTQGVAAMKLRKGHKVANVYLYTEGALDTPDRYRARTIPASGKLPEETGEQLTF